MHPATGGVIRGLSDRGAEIAAEITVASAVLYPETTLHVQQRAGEASWTSAYIVLDEEGRRELIELLGGEWAS